VRKKQRVSVRDDYHTESTVGVNQEVQREREKVREGECVRAREREREKERETGV